MKKVLSIAGSDSSGGAGIQADIKTISALGHYAMTAVTSLTAQNTMGVFAVQDSTPEFLKAQIDCVFTDIFPDAVKIGMLSSSRLIKTIGERLRFYKAKNIVLDTVMISTSGTPLLDITAQETLKSVLFPIADVITPNIPEAQELSCIRISSKNDMQKAVAVIGDKYETSVLCKGGHLGDNASDLLYTDNRFIWFEGEKIDSKNTHGTGCTLSSAIACGLADNLSLEESVYNAKQYINGAIKASLNIGSGNGPLNHFWNSL